MLTLNILGESERHEALCPTCIYAVTQKGFNGEALTSCCLGGTLRELRFTVSECSAYTDQRIPKPRPEAGFVRPVPKGEPGVTVIEIA